MGYSILVGNAVPVFDKIDFPYLEARWEVQPQVNSDAPTFINDEMTGSSNGRSPSYSTWSDFCKAVGIYDLFYDYRGNLIGGHPGCTGITKELAEKIAQAKLDYGIKAKLPAGFEGYDWNLSDPPRYDGYLARIIWLDYWVQWAIKNCETPAISNT